MVQMIRCHLVFLAVQVNQVVPVVLQVLYLLEDLQLLGLHLAQAIQLDLQILKLRMALMALKDQALLVDLEILGNLELLLHPEDRMFLVFQVSQQIQYLQQHQGILVIQLVLVLQTDLEHLEVLDYLLVQDCQEYQRVPPDQHCL
jgi:hypothetical protein